MHRYSWNYIYEYIYPYSIWKPETSSDSPTTKSKELLLFSAKQEI